MAIKAIESVPNLVIQPGFTFEFIGVVSLVTGCLFLMWLGGQITERGLGNGISIIIFSGIAAGLPSALGRMFELVRTAAPGNASPLLSDPGSQASANRTRRPRRA